MLETYLRRGIMQYKSLVHSLQDRSSMYSLYCTGVLVWTVTKELKAYKAEKQAA